MTKKAEIVGEKVDYTKAIDAYLITPQLLRELSPVNASARSNMSLDSAVKNLPIPCRTGRCHQCNRLGSPGADYAGRFLSLSLRSR